MTDKPCKVCGSTRRYKSGRCGDCAVKRQRDRREKNHAGHLARKYGITAEDYNRMLAAQGCVCAICGKPEKGKRLAVDHCHATGRVRGLLCMNCNRAIGHFQDDPDLMLRGAQYVQKLPT